MRILAIVLVMLLLALMVACGGGGASSVPQKEVRDTANAELQEKRLELIDKLKDRKIIQKIETPGTDPRMYVLPAFDMLTFDEKQSFANVCYAYAYGLPKEDLGSFDEPMWIYDAMTNHKVGDFSAKRGLNLD